MVWGSGFRDEGSPKPERKAQSRCVSQRSNRKLDAGYSTRPGPLSPLDLGFRVKA